MTYDSLLSSGLLPSGLISSELTTHRQSIPSADPCKGWLSSMDLVILAQPLALIYCGGNVENAVEETEQ